jgi:Domain of unknown function (DUF6927)
MGWTYTFRPRGMTDLEFFTRQWGEKFSSKIKATASKNGVFYAVYETDAEKSPELVPDANGKVRVALVVLTKRAPKSEYNFGWKDMDEFSGPYYYECPARLLDMLSPFRLEAAFAAAGKWGSGMRSASGWRHACRANAAKQKNRLKLKDGMKVKLPKPLTFADGAVLDTFTVRKRAFKRGFVFMNNFGAYRLRKNDLLNLTAVS